jgi:hypothetical protein
MSSPTAGARRSSVWPGNATVSACGITPSIVRQDSTAPLGFDRSRPIKTPGDTPVSAGRRGVFAPRTVPVAPGPRRKRHASPGCNTAATSSPRPTAFLAPTFQRGSKCGRSGVPSVPGPLVQPRLLSHAGAWERETRPRRPARHRERYQGSGKSGGVRACAARPAVFRRFGSAPEGPEHPPPGGVLPSANPRARCAPARQSRGPCPARLPPRRVANQRRVWTCRSGPARCCSLRQGWRPRP